MVTGTDILQPGSEPTHVTLFSLLNTSVGLHTYNLSENYVFPNHVIAKDISNRQIIV